MAIHVPDTRLEGRVSQNFDIGVSSKFIACRSGDLKKNTKKSQKLPVFCSKMKTRTSIKNLRHPSLDQNVLYTYWKSGMCRSYTK